MYRFSKLGCFHDLAPSIYSNSTDIDCIPLKDQFEAEEILSGNLDGQLLVLKNPGESFKESDFSHIERKAKDYLINLTVIFKESFAANRTDFGSWREFLVQIHLDDPSSYNEY